MKKPSSHAKKPTSGGLPKDLRRQLGAPGSPKAFFQKRAPQRQADETPALNKLKGRELVQALKERYPKKVWKPSAALMPTPVVMISCGGEKSDYPANIITAAWVGTVNSEPPMLSISLRPERYSREIIGQTHEFVVNIPTAAQAKATDWCGVRSGREADKFATMKLTALPGREVKCPIIADCPINIECKAVKIIPLGSHDLILARIQAVQVSESVLDKKGKLKVEDVNPLAYAHGEYHALGKKLGYFGFSVRGGRDR